MLYNFLEDLNFTNLLLFGLATWRISTMFVRETGPLGIFVHLRQAVGITHYEDTGEIEEEPDTFLGELFSCVYCMSVWIALLLVSWWLLEPVTALLFFLWMSGSAMASILSEHA